MIKLIKFFFALIFCVLYGNVLAANADYSAWSGGVNYAYLYATPEDACQATLKYLKTVDSNIVNAYILGPINYQNGTPAYANCVFVGLNNKNAGSYQPGSFAHCDPGTTLTHVYLSRDPATCEGIYVPPPPPPPPPSPPTDPSCQPDPGKPDSCHYNPDTASADKNLGKACATCHGEAPLEHGNPINHGNGNKRQLELDYQSAANGGLQLQRTYNGNSARNGRFGTRWSSNYERRVWHDLTNYPKNVGVQREDGKILPFTVTSGGMYQPDVDITDSLSRQTDNAGNTIGWQYRVAADQSLESYDTDGKLLSVTSRTGLVQTLSYSDAATPVAVASQPGLLISVSDHAGHRINFAYDSSNRVIQMTDPAGGTVGYIYDNSNRLSSVRYQDGKTHLYAYNEPAYTSGANLPNALTCIFDENGERYATFNYDSSGRAISTEHAGGVEKYSIDYTQPGSQSTVTDPMGTVRSYTFQTLFNTIKSTGQNQPSGAGSGAASSAVTYDGNGNVASYTDFSGGVTNYSYDLASNLETRRVEAAGTAQARTISTQWHATLRLPIKVAEPKRITTYVYDSSGNLLSKTAQATTDVNGSQDFSGAVTGMPRIWSYTYNGEGQILTATGPRTDVVDKTTYTYDASGNLSTMTNPMGQVMTLSNYDAHGRAGTIVNVNGAITSLTYSPRGWITRQNTTSGDYAEVTSYDYDGVGQLIKITWPDASTMAYTYDPAHRLTNIADSLGNIISYTLDNMGRRIREEVADPRGVLNQKITRTYDALNRLQQSTNGGKAPPPPPPPPPPDPTPGTGDITGPMPNVPSRYSGEPAIQMFAPQLLEAAYRARIIVLVDNGEGTLVWEWSTGGYGWYGDLLKNHVIMKVGKEYQLKGDIHNRTPPQA